MTTFCNFIGQNDQKYVQGALHDQKDSEHDHQAKVASLVSKLAKIGTFWPFLTTFGIESVTRLMKIFFRHFISVKTTNGCTKC